MHKIMLLFLIFTEVSVLHEPPKVKLPNFFWIFILVLLYLILWKRNVKTKRLKHYKIKIKQCKPHFVYQSKVILLLLLLINFKRLFKLKCKQEMFLKFCHLFLPKSTCMIIVSFIFVCDPIISDLFLHVT